MWALGCDCHESGNAVIPAVMLSSQATSSSCGPFAFLLPEVAVLPSSFDLCAVSLASAVTGKFQHTPWNRLVFLVSIKVSKDVVFVFSMLSLFQPMASPPPPVATRTSKALCGFSGGKGRGKSEDPVWRQLTNSIPCCHHYPSPLQSYDLTSACVLAHRTSRLPGGQKMAVVPIA